MSVWIFMQIKGELFVNLEEAVLGNLKPTQRQKELRLQAQQQGCFSFFPFISCEKGLCFFTVTIVHDGDVYDLCM